MKPIRFVFVGQAKAPFFREAEDHYLEAVTRSIATLRVVVKDARAGGPAARIATEGRGILERLGPNDSPALADRRRTRVEDPGRSPCFVVGGAYGLAAGVLARADETVSLGPGTLPHELARVVLLEQIYRATTILRGAPYHH